ncbi:MAG: carboxypeptidase-like regulatory domain-containing protein, partial [Bacteroidota bacterium]
MTNNGWKLVLVLCCFALSGAVSAQTINKIPGVTIDDSTGAPVPYAKIYNKTLQKGTISNVDGYFELPYGGAGDSVTVSHLGYQTFRTVIRLNSGPLELRLNQSPRLLEGIVITATDNSYLYDLLNACRKNASQTKQYGKAYYELATFREAEQVELVEGYYNVRTKGYNIEDLQIKTGRLAIKPQTNTLFVSMESSNAVIKQDLLQMVPYYPISPLQLSKRRMRKRFYLSLDRRYLSPEADSIYVLKCEPKKNIGQDYSGLIWVNKSKNAISRVEFDCENCKRHPFLPLFQSDSIERVDLQFQKNYLPEAGNTNFTFVNLDYDIRYRSRRTARDDTFSVRTHAVLYAYDYARRFYIPQFDFGPLAR